MMLIVDMAILLIVAAAGLMGWTTWKQRRHRRRAEEYMHRQYLRTQAKMRNRHPG